MRRESSRPAAALPTQASQGLSGEASLNILAFVAGKVVDRDLVGPGGVTLAVRGTRITHELVDPVEVAGLLPEMIVYMTLPEDER